MSFILCKMLLLHTSMDETIDLMLLVQNIELDLFKKNSYLWRYLMKLTKEEALWLADKFYDIYYALNVDEMYEKDQKIFRSIERKLSEIK